MKIHLSIVLILVSLSFKGWGQLKVYPIVSDKQSGKTLTHSRTLNSEPLELPFWEDFSTSGNIPDSSLWQDSDNVRINNGSSFTPPSINVATFDGLDALGQPYGAGSNGLVDSLSSRPIDLSSYSFADDIFISFYYQAGGTADLPDDGNDSLRLEFLDSSGNWIGVWPTGGDLIYDGEFHQVILPIADEEYLHDRFRFRFQSVGNLTGMFDIWNLDYIYINRNRSVNDTSYPDRTMSEPLSSFLNDYYTVPYSHYADSVNRQPDFWIRNLVTGSLIQNKAYFYFFNYEIDVTDTLGNTTSFEDSQLVEPFESPIGIGETERVTLRRSLADFGDINAADSARVLIEIILDAEDNKTINDGGDYDPSKYAPVDFRSNDTLRNTFYLTDHYAYDDGVAEAAAGLNFAGDFFAVQFDPLIDSARLTAVDMYFPFIGSEPAGRSIDIIIWDEDNGFPGEVLFRQQIIVQRNGGLNNLIRYPLEQSVLIRGTFFAGYRQNNNGELGLGLDVNTQSGDKMFFNLDELWEANTLVSGSVMMRPVFGVIDDEEVVSNELDISDKVMVWPNPSNDGIFKTTGNIRSWRLYDLRGALLSEFTNSSPGDTQLRIDMQAYDAGIYLLQVETRKGDLSTIKLMRR